jgi:CheY-like chemotaxis protein
MDGFTVVEQLKNNETTRSIPIIIVSAKDLTSQETNFLNGQVEALLHKNLFTEKELLADVQQALLQIHQKDVIKI